MERDVFTAIADPIRREIIDLISEKPLNIQELTQRFSISRPGVRKHVRILNECGLLEIRKEGREGYCEPRLEALGEIALWANRYRRFWNDRLDRLENELSKDQAD